MELSANEICCPICNMSFWISYEAWQTYIRSSKNIFCPNGHKMWISNNGHLIDCAKQNEELIKDLQNRNQALYRSNCSYRGVITRMKKKSGEAGKNK